MHFMTQSYLRMTSQHTKGMLIREAILPHCSIRLASDSVSFPSKVECTHVIGALNGKHITALKPGYLEVSFTVIGDFLDCLGDLDG